MPPFEKLYNFRDLGGLPTSNGHTIPTGFFYRSAELSRLSPRDQQQLADLNIQLICDLRSPSEHTRKPARLASNAATRIANVSLHDPVNDTYHRKLFGVLLRKDGVQRFEQFRRGYYHHLTVERAPYIGQALTVLSETGRHPALIHCTAGKDRTGIVSALLQLLAGAPYEAVLADYLRTNDAYAPHMDRFTRRMRLMTLYRAPIDRIHLVLSTHAASLNEVHAHIMNAHGSVESYLLNAARMDPAALTRLQHLLANGRR